ncbi:MAG TPA: hypothetical protein VLE97_10820 [Gaiellaceae bacterium]|nr:hypothetical protein [Gaiellaceae bacterium]
MKKAAPPVVEEQEAEAEPELAEPTILEDAAIDKGPAQTLRDAYRELRAAYVELHKRHHERIDEGLAERREEGKKTGGDVPYGYRLGDDGETLVENEAEQAVIAEAVRLREQGLSLRRVAQELWKRKMRPRPVPKERRRGALKTKRFGEFDPTQIRRMIETHKSRAQPAD